MLASLFYITSLQNTFAKQWVGAEPPPVHIKGPVVPDLTPLFLPTAVAKDWVGPQLLPIINLGAPSVVEALLKLLVGPLPSFIAKGKLDTLLEYHKEAGREAVHMGKVSIAYTLPLLRWQRKLIYRSLDTLLEYHKQAGREAVHMGRLSVA